MAVFRYQNGDRPLDGYTIEYGIGRGGFGEVYYAVSDAGRQVALKEIQNYQDIELRGIGHCMNLKSQHLVSIFDVKNAEDGTPWVIMEYVSGASLRQILDDSPEGIGEEKAAFFVRELAKGLTYLHGAGVVHRDLKPHNVFFEDGIVKIGDYSLSKVITTSHRSGHTMTVGSVHYMAPEISMGSYDKTVDIYALGIMLHEMLTGQPPFVGESMGEVLMKHLSSEPDVSGIAEPYASTIRKAMRRDPENRFQSAEEMASALFGASEISDITGAFGPASLSIVAEQVARHAQVDTNRTTDRVKDALAETISMSQSPVESHFMYGLGRMIRKVAIAGAFIPEDKPAMRLRDQDMIKPVWRLVLGAMTLVVMLFAVRLIANTLGLFEATDHPLAVVSRDGIVLTGTHVFSVAITMLLGTLLTRQLLDRRIFLHNPFVNRVVQCGACVATWFLLSLPMTPLSFDGLASYSLMLTLPLALPFVFQDWSLLTHPLRSRRIRLSPVLVAGIIASVGGMQVGLPVTYMAFAMGASMGVQVAASFLGRDTNDQLDEYPTSKRPVVVEAPADEPSLMERTLAMVEV